jgi:hypothetical protein
MKYIMVVLFSALALWAQPTSLELAEAKIDSALLYAPIIILSTDTVRECVSCGLRHALDSMNKASAENELRRNSDLLDKLRHKSVEGDSILTRLQNYQAYKSDTRGRVRYRNIIENMYEEY